ncbi:MAG: hypothetical protein Q9M36_12735 [Sulfurovum sp.]|nr:hypothetical protein [Sulfurovum sp.]
MKISLSLLDTSAEAHMPDTPYSCLIVPKSMVGRESRTKGSHPPRLAGNTCLAGDIMWE